MTLLEIDAAGSAYALLGDAAGTAFVSSGGLAHAGNADDYFVKLNTAGNTFLDASYSAGARMISHWPWPWTRSRTCTWRK